MPTYDYECNACGHKFEFFQSITSSPIRKCPDCKKLKVRRLIGTGAGIIFKGSGFYCTDYRDKTYTAAANKDKADTSTPAGSGEKASSGSDKAAPAKAAESTAASKPEKSGKKFTADKA